MSAPDIDWSPPWWDGWRNHGQRVQRRWQAGLPVREALSPTAAVQAAVDLPCFVAQSALPATQAYEHFIFDTHSVPTRDNVHDFLNGLCWWRFTQSKHALNRLQAAEIARHGVGATRGPVRDSLTLFDENAALLQAPPAVWQALLARNWRRLFVDLRPLWAQARLVLFGHALLEKLVTPYKSITAHVYVQPVPPALAADAAWDAWLAGRLQTTPWASKPFTPLPVLGVPGWWPANEAVDFYDDAGVFRPPRC